MDSVVNTAKAATETLLTDPAQLIRIPNSALAEALKLALPELSEDKARAVNEVLTVTLRTGAAKESVPETEAKAATFPITAEQILKGFSVSLATDPKLAAHAAVKLSLKLPANQPIAFVLSELLGADDAALLIADWRDRGITFNDNAPSESDATFFPSSNNKTRLTQKADFKAAGLRGMADDLQATLICAVLVRKARDAGIDPTKPSKEWNKTAAANLNPQELGLLIKLRDGLVRTCFGALGVYAGDRLRASDCFDGGGYPRSWALGGSSAAE